MIDFQNKKVFKLIKTKEKNIPNDVMELLISEERIVGYYTSLRDYVVFTDKRLIACNVQGITGTKKILLHYHTRKFKLFQSKLQVP